MKIAFQIILGVLCAALPGVPLGCWLVWTHDTGVDERVRLDGEAVGKNADRIEAWVSERTARKLESTIVLGLPDGDLEASLEELGFVPEVERTVEAIESASSTSHSGDPLACWESFAALRAGQVDVPIAIGVEPGVLIEYLLDLKAIHDLPPREARIDFASGAISDHTSGSSLEVYAASAAVEKAVLLDGLTTVDLPVASIEPAITADTLASLDANVVLAEFSTTFPRAGKNSSRAHNVAHGASKLDGAIIMPGHILSFNAIVGERSLEAGFMEAPEIYEGEMIEGVGGGTCQISSTFHAAAVHAGLEIIERYPHSRPSSYIRMGLDATVSYPTVDLRVRNPYPMPVVVRASTLKGRITVEILGPLKVVDVKFSTRIIRKDTFEEVVEEDPSMQVGVLLVKQYGLPGYLLRRIRTLTYTDGTVKVEKTTDYYPPTTHLTVVHPSTGYGGLSDEERGIEAEDADEGALEGEALEDRPADFAAPEPLEKPPSEPTWTIVNGPFAHPPKPKKKP